MGLIVQKFGGTSVADIECIQSVAARIMHCRAEGNDVVVVVSAMAGETNRLLGLAEDLCDCPDRRELDSLLSTGEQVSSALLAIILNDRGCKAKSLNAFQARIKTNSAFGQARIESIDYDYLMSELSSGYVIVIAGFQGIDEMSNITTLGRGGSDTTAVALAAALKADECQVFTDVDGVYTTDPRMVPHAHRLNTITFEEMLELSSVGAKILQTRAVEFAGKYEVPLRVLASHKDGPGTLITYNRHNLEAPLVSGIAFSSSEAKITILGIPDKPGVASCIIGSLNQFGIHIDMLIQNAAEDGTTDFTFTVLRKNHQEAYKIIENLLERLGARSLNSDNRVAKVTVVGVGMKAHAGIANNMFDTLASEGINIMAISTSETKVSVLINEKYLELSVRILHSAFGLDEENMNI